MRKVFILFLLFSMNVCAQAPSLKKWDHRYGGDLIDNPKVLIQTLDQGFVLCGSTVSPQSYDVTEITRGGIDYWIARTDSAGNMLWDKRFGGSRDDYLTCGLALPDSGFLLGGYSQSDISGDKSEANRDALNHSRDFWVIRIDKSGNKIWDKTLGGIQDDFMYSIILLADGSFLLGGGSGSDSSADKSQHTFGVADYWIVKIDSNGNKIWDHSYGGTNWDWLYSAGMTSDHGFVLGGFSNSNMNICKSQNCYLNQDDYWIIKIDSNGTELWDRTLGGNREDILNSLLVLPGDNLLLAGYSISDIGFDKSVANHGVLIRSDDWIIKTDALGNKLWDKVYGGDDYEDELDNVIIINDGFLICGTSYSNTSGDKSEDNLLNSEQGWAIAIDSSGNKLWDKTFNNPDHIEFNFGMQNKDSCYTFLSFADVDGGDVSQNRNSDQDYWIVKYCQTNPPPVAAFISSNNATCQNTCIDFTNLSQNANSYQWFFAGGTPSSDTSQNPQGICYSTSGTFAVTLIATNANGIDTLISNNYITVHPQISFSPLTQNGDTLFSVPGYVSYQWYYDLTLINGANNYYYIAPQNGDYSVLITDSNGCTALAKKLNVIAAVQDIQNLHSGFSAYYSSGILYLNINSPIATSSILEITDALGKILFKEKIILQKGENKISQIISEFPNGIYFVKILNANKIYAQPIFIK